MSEETFSRKEQPIIYQSNCRERSRGSLSPNSEVRLNNLAQRERMNELNQVQRLPAMM